MRDPRLRERLGRQAREDMLQGYDARRMPTAGGGGAFIGMTANVLPDRTGVPRIVMVLPAYLPESFGGAEQQTRRLAQALARRGAAVTLLAPRLEAERRRERRRGPLSYGASGCVRPRIWADGTSMPSCGGVFASRPGYGETDEAMT